MARCLEGTSRDTRGKFALQIITKKYSISLPSVRCVCLLFHCVSSMDSYFFNIGRVRMCEFFPYQKYNSSKHLQVRMEFRIYVFGFDVCIIYSTDVNVISLLCFFGCNFCEFRCECYGPSD